jgi:hypothetical protein
MISPKQVIDIVKENAEYLAHQHELIDIYEGNLCKYVDAEMSKQLSAQSYLQAKFRMAPINVLPKVIDKLTHIYQTPVVRRVEDGTPSDQELLDWYIEKMRLNPKMNSANEMFNLCGSTLLYPFVYENTPQLRVILNDRFVVYSDDPIQPTKPTYVILLAGRQDDKDIFWVWSATEFMICDSDGKVRTDIMLKYNNIEGINPLGVLPFVYVNESDYKLCPVIETDTLKMVKLLPIMLSDLNLAAMFQSFSIIYGIDLDDENIKFAPNAFWRLKSDATSDKKPEIGQIKPQVDFDQVLKLIESQFSLWLGTKGIRAGAVGQLSPENLASGISKIIDEMDTFEARQKQVTEFQDAEMMLWNLLLNHMHPYWSETGQIDNRAIWTPTAQVKTLFVEQLPTQNRGNIVRDLRDEFQSGFTSRKRAIAKLNPTFSEEQIEELMEEIAEERTVTVEPEPTQPPMQPEEETEDEETED